MYIIENEKVRVAFDENGNLQELTNLVTEHNYAGGYPVWKLVFQRNNTFELDASADMQPTIMVGDNQIVLAYDKAICQGEEIAFGVRVTASLDDDNVVWGIKLLNNEPDCIIRDVLFPIVHDMQLPDEHELIHSGRGGKKCINIKRHIKSHHTLWTGKDHIFTQWSEAYPKEAATNCFTFASQDDGLYFGIHSNQNEETAHVYRMYGEKLSVCMNRYPGCETGQTWGLDGYVVSPYNGSWHTAANKYRCWLNTPECEWFELHEIPEWVRKMPGWQRIILKHQYGEIHYKYDELPQIRKDGEKANIDSLLLFGWHNGGHDNNYPDYTPDPELGTEDELKAGIKDFTDHNGQVMLYANGQLIDMNSDFYKKHGSSETLKDLNGNSLRDKYSFSSGGLFYRNVANRAFEHGCPCSKLWEKELMKVVDTAYLYGCQSVFFDQLGYSSVACCDPKHGHLVPNFAQGIARSEQIKRLRQRARSHNENMALGIEIIADVTGCQADYVHSLNGFAYTPDDWESTGKKPKSEYFIDWFRYMFPEIIITDREIRDDSDIERRVNHTILKGLRNDVEIYRCRETIAETPNYQKYLGKANALRKKHSELLLEGMYRDTEYFEIDNDEIEARSFVNGNKMAVVLTQSHLKEGMTKLDVPGYRFVEADGLNEFKVEQEGNKFKIELGQHGLIVVVFEKTEYNEGK